VLTAALSALFAFVGLACAGAILAHAFRRSVGTGVMVLLVPAYLLVYAFSRFEHRRKGLLVAGLLACSTLSAVLYGASVGQLLPPAPVFQPIP
jgi:translocator protein